MDKQFFIGMDIGSTTVKAVLVDAVTDKILFRTTSGTTPSSPKKFSNC